MFRCSTTWKNHCETHIRVFHTNFFWWVLGVICLVAESHRIWPPANLKIVCRFSKYVTFDTNWRKIWNILTSILSGWLKVSYLADENSWFYMRVSLSGHLQMVLFDTSGTESTYTFLNLPFIKVLSHFSVFWQSVLRNGIEAQSAFWNVPCSIFIFYPLFNGKNHEFVNEEPWQIESTYIASYYTYLHLA